MNCKPAFLKTITLLLIGLIGTTLISCSNEPASIETQANVDESTEIDEKTEVIEPIGQFIATGSMGNDRQSHHMVLLNDGRIFTTGGRGKGTLMTLRRRRKGLGWKSRRRRRKKRRI